MTTRLPPGLDDPALPELLDCDHELAAVGRRIKVLKGINWPVELEARFLDGWRRGAPVLPDPPPPELHCEQDIAALDALMRRLDRSHPIGNWLFKTAWSYRVAAEMLQHAGQPRFTECSTLLYGRPDTLYRSQDATNFDAANELLAITDELVGHAAIPTPPTDIPALRFAKLLRGRIDEFFTDDQVEVVLDPALPSRATAGSRRIRIRKGAQFSARDLEQLVQHEAFIHTATLLNGRHQPYLHSLGIGAPRTTRVQEGLATYSEIITGAIDLVRLRRIALRVVMLKHALDGADFIEVFRGFLEAGQTEVESYASASRLFRGGDVRGRVCFTKDGAYLEGVLMVHVFTRKTLQEGRVDLLPLLFAGRLTTADVVSLAPYRDNGLIAPPLYVPPWARDPQRVLALMAFFTAAQRIRLDRLDLQRFVEYEDEVVAASGFTGH